MRTRLLFPLHIPLIITAPMQEWEQSHPDGSQSGRNTARRPTPPTPSRTADYKRPFNSTSQPLLRLAARSPSAVVSSPPPGDYAFHHGSCYYWKETSNRTRTGWPRQRGYQGSNSLRAEHQRSGHVRGESGRSRMCQLTCICTVGLARRTRTRYCSLLHVFLA